LVLFILFICMYYLYTFCLSVSLSFLFVCLSNAGKMSKTKRHRKSKIVLNIFHQCRNKESMFFYNIVLIKVFGIISIKVRYLC